MATTTTAGLNGVQHLPNLGAVPLKPMAAGGYATPAWGAFKPGTYGVNGGANMNSDANQPVGGAWSDVSPTVSDPSKWSMG